jgi:hypothetical protein
MRHSVAKFAGAARAVRTNAAAFEEVQAINKRACRCGWGACAELEFMLIVSLHVWILQYDAHFIKSREFRKSGLKADPTFLNGESSKIKRIFHTSSDSDK